MHKASVSESVMNGLLFLLTFLEELMGVKGDHNKLKPSKRSIAGVDQEELMDPSLLADPDSCFYEFNGVHLHHKIQSADENQREGQREYQNMQARNIRLPMILLHGFGASVFSWSKVMSSLARLSGSKVLAFDRPAFGLTSRVDYHPNSASIAMTSTRLEPYSMLFSVHATLSFMDFLEGEKTIIVGHSYGSLVAVNTYFEAPQRVAALILVAPAIVAPLISSNISRENRNTREYEMENVDYDSYDKQNLSHANGSFIYACYFGVGRAMIELVNVIMKLISYFYRNLLHIILRSYCALLLLRVIVDKFGIAAVRTAWYDAAKATQNDIDGYTKPLKAKDWDKALLEFIIATVTPSRAEKGPSIKRRLSEITCPVLIITGDKDRVVPAWNAKRLSLVIPGSHLEVLKNCGHLPHEERPEDFISVVNTFLSTAFETHS